MIKNGLNSEVLQQSIRRSAACIDEEVIWIVDAVLGGLYSIDKVTYEVKNVLDPSQIFKRGKFRISSVLKWKNNIIIVPFQLEREWVIYNIISKELKYEKVVKQDWKASCMCIIGERGILTPLSILDPVIIVDLENFSCLRIMDNWFRGDASQLSVKRNTSWIGMSTDAELLFSLYDAGFVILANQNRVKVHTIDVPFGICSISVFEDEIWILPTGGNYIFVADLEGNIIDTVLLTTQDCPIRASEFVRIVATKRYVFLLPFTKKEIYVYDKCGKKVIVINPGEGRLENIFPRRFTTSYWEYFIEKNTIFFLPEENTFLAIDLDSLECKQTDIFLPSVISGYGLKYWFQWNKIYDDNAVIYEDGESMLSPFLEHISDINSMREVGGDIQYGNLIWNHLITDR